MICGDSNFDHHFESRESIAQFAQYVIGQLQVSAPDLKRDSEWTKSNFKTLTNIFPKDKTSCFHRRSKGSLKKTGKEFLWDFMAVRKMEGFLYLVAESEAKSAGKEAIRKLKHDFEKLLYVFAPIRVMLCKSKDEKHAKEIANELQNYAREHCVNFGVGSVFIIHCCLAQNRGSVSYYWQSKRKSATPLKRESITFGEPIIHLKAC